MPRPAVTSDADLAGAVTRGQRAVLLVPAAAATLVAWLWLMRKSASPQHVHSALLMPGRHDPLGFGSFASLVLMWQAMMVAMMTPSVMHWVLTFAALSAAPASVEA